ncbi:NAD(P)H-dependent oxidoreductase [Paenibacillus albicereus]|uniref:NAD(P)H-dependent oxidoreductase n=1 Tax=Paenibacillus albicereus TaxID=2726185 RepID=A0A6H2GXN0_9BACL|nr:NAD(P)H-dependent oxidoreductase [Paenibacillus albicereus]QJC51926.1 NAD(P)H-dependent oxidoreductase [Paenibacillus albicereus]
MKTLVIVVHPALATASVVHKRWVEELRKHPDRYTVHELHEAYPDEKIDVQAEQKLIESHGNLVLQFPVYWFHGPPLLKKWLDEVLLYGWAFGRKGNKLENRRVGLAVSAGIQESDYAENGTYRYTLPQLMAPFEVSFRYCKADYRSLFAFYGQETEQGGNEENGEAELPAGKLEQSARDYIAFLDSL